MSRTGIGGPNTPEGKRRGGTFIQRMSIDDWFVVTEEERNGADCQACEVYRKRLEQQEEGQE